MNDQRQIKVKMTDRFRQAAKDFHQGSDLCEPVTAIVKIFFDNELKDSRLVFGGYEMEQVKKFDCEVRLINFDDMRLLIIQDEVADLIEGKTIDFCQSRIVVLCPL